MAKWPWIERSLPFDYPPTKFTDLLERVRGTPARLEEMVRGLDKETLTYHDGQGWSIQQNVGHLLDTEDLSVSRIEQILRGEQVLIAADMTNRKTHEANHDASDMGGLLADFRAARERVVRRLEELDETDWGKGAFHRRLGKSLRIVDIVCMIGEHDDYHLARVRQLIKAKKITCAGY